MSNGNEQCDGGVALLVDFENLALAVEDGRGEVDCGALMTLAAGYGPVWGANLYADWRTRTMRQYQEDLYGVGMEFVQVLGRCRGRVLKNAVDIRIAVDAMELVCSAPRIDVYVLVTGDRDFLEVVRALQRHGKTVVGVAPLDAASGELAGLCDRFVYYETIAGRAGPRPGTADGRGAVRALARGGRAAGGAVLRVLGFRGPTSGGDLRGGGNGSGLGVSPSVSDGGPRGKGWGWFEWAREQVESGAVAVNAEGSWLHRIGDYAFVVVPDCFEDWAAREGVAASTAKNRVRRLRRHRPSQRRNGGSGDRFRAVLGDGRKAEGMLFPGGLLWGDDAPEDGSATLL